MSFLDRWIFSIAIVFLGLSAAVGTFSVRVPAPGWLPSGYVAPTESKGLVTAENLLVGQAVKTPQFICYGWSYS